MTWDDALTRLEKSGLNPVEETYMENYGKVLSAQRPEFRERYFRCTYGVVNCNGLKLELFLFPDEAHPNEFLDVVGNDPWWLVHNNLALHFADCDPAFVARVLDALA